MLILKFYWSKFQQPLCWISLFMIGVVNWSVIKGFLEPFWWQLGRSIRPATALLLLLLTEIPTNDQKFRSSSQQRAGQPLAGLARMSHPVDRLLKSLLNFAANESHLGPPRVTKIWGGPPKMETLWGHQKVGRKAKTNTRKGSLPYQLFGLVT